MDSETVTAPEAGRNGISARLLRYLPWLALSHLLIGAPTLLISLVVAYGTFEQADATRQIQKASAWPYLAYTTSNIDAAKAPQISLSLVNNGVGPALVETMEVRYRGKPVASAEDLLAACCGGLRPSNNGLGTATVVGTVLRPGDRQDFVILEPTATNAELLQRFNAERRQVTVRLCYCSIFDECWSGDGDALRPPQVASCPADWIRFRQR